MSFFTLDRNNMGSGDFKPLEIGEYECIISKVETAESSNGNQMLKVTLTVRDDVSQEGGKRKIFDNIVFTEKAMFKVNQFANAVGIEGAGNLDEFASQALYKPVRIKNKHEEYNGKTNDKVAFYNPAQVEYNGQGGTSADPFANDSNTIDISDEDLPF